MSVAATVGSSASSSAGRVGILERSSIRGETQRAGFQSDWSVHGSRDESSSSQTSFASRVLASFRRSIFGKGKEGGSRQRSCGSGRSSRSNCVGAAASSLSCKAEVFREGTSKCNGGLSSLVEGTSAGLTRTRGGRGISLNSPSPNINLTEASTETAADRLFLHATGGPVLFPQTAGCSRDVLIGWPDRASMDSLSYIPSSPFDGGASQGLDDPLFSDFAVFEDGAYYKGTPPPCRSSLQASTSALCSSPAPVVSGSSKGAEGTLLLGPASATEQESPPPFAERPLPTGETKSSCCPQRLGSKTSQDAGAIASQRSGAAFSSNSSLPLPRRQSLSFPISSLRVFSQSQVEEAAVAAAATVAAEASASLWGPSFPPDENTPLFFSQPYGDLEAVKSKREALAWRQSLLPLSQGAAESEIGKPEESLASFDEGLKTLRRGTPVGHSKSSSSLGVWSRAQDGQFSSSRQLHRLLRRRLSALPPPHPRPLRKEQDQPLTNLKNTLLQTGNAGDSHRAASTPEPSGRTAGSSPRDSIACRSSSSLPGVALIQRLLFGAQPPPKTEPASETGETCMQRKRNFEGELKNAGGKDDDLPSAVSRASEEVFLFATPVASPMNGERGDLGAEGPESESQQASFGKTGPCAVPSEAAVLEAEDKVCDDSMPCVFIAEEERLYDPAEQRTSPFRSASFLPPLEGGPDGKCRSFAFRRKSLPLRFERLPLEVSAVSSEGSSSAKQRLASVSSPRKSSPVRLSEDLETESQPCLTSQKIPPSLSQSQPQQHQQDSLPGQPSERRGPLSPSRRPRVKTQSPAKSRGPTGSPRTRPTTQLASQDVDDVEVSPQSVNRKRRRDAPALSSSPSSEPAAASAKDRRSLASQETHEALEAAESGEGAAWEVPSGKRRRRKSFGLPSFRTAGAAAWISSYAAGNSAWEAALPGPALSAKETKLLREEQQREKERQEKERQERERQERERQERERQERERQERERQERERQERERQERERQERERQERERQERERQEKERQEKERQEKEGGSSSETLNEGRGEVQTGPHQTNSVSATAKSSLVAFSGGASSLSDSASSSSANKVTDTASASSSSVIENSKSVPASAKSLLGVAEKHSSAAAASSAAGVLQQQPHHQQSPFGLNSNNNNNSSSQSFFSGGASVVPGFQASPPKFGGGAIPGFGSATFSVAGGGETNVFAVGQRRGMRGRGRGCRR